MFARTKGSAAVALALSTLAIHPLPGWAQQQLERVEITGSSLRRVDAETALPVTIIRVEELTRQGITNAEQALQRISSNQTSNNFSISGSVSQPSGGKSEADLRGLSSTTGQNSTKTLVLLNGRRLSNHSFDSAGVDLNAIPLAAVSRIEVLRDGASAIYGTDAIGGVINFILRRDYQGLEAAGETIRPRGDGGGATNRASITAGFGSLTENRFNIMGTLDVRRQSALEAKDRPFGATGVVLGEVVAGTSGTSFPGDVDGFEPSLPACAPPSSIPNPAGTACRYDFARDADLIPKNNQRTALVRGSFAITPEHTASLELLHAKHENISRFAAAPNTYILLASSPFFPPGAPLTTVPDASGAGVPGNVVNFRLVPGGRRTVASDTTNQRTLFELQGELAGWDYRSAIGQAKNKSEVSVAGGFLFDDVIQQGLYDGFVNPFGAQTAAGAGVFDAATARGLARVGSSDIKFADLRVTRDLLQLPAGPLAAAFGTEHRREKSSFIATDITAQLGSLGIDPDSDTSGKRDVTALFSELGIPIVKNLDLTLAARFDRYSDFGNTVNPKVGVRWQPLRQLLFRGSYNTGFRAPTLYEIYEPAALNFTDDVYDDPLLCPGGVAAPGASAGVVCGQQVLQRESGPAALGRPIESLEPEKSKALTLGMVFEPVSGVTLGFDVWQIKIRNLISEYPEQATFGDPVANAARFVRCSQLPAGPGPGIDRSDADVCLNFPTFDPIAFIDAPNENLGELKTSGIDLAAAWRSGALPIGNIGVLFDATYVTRYDYQRERGGAFINAVGRYSDNAPVFRWQHALTLQWSSGSWGATLAQRFKNGYADQDGVRKVGTYDVYDASVSFVGIKNLTLIAGIKNLFDRDPPTTVQTSTAQRGYDPRFTDPLGRAFLVRAAYRFY